MKEIAVDYTNIAVETQAPLLEDRQLVKWIARQPPEDQGRLVTCAKSSRILLICNRIASECFKHFLDAAAQPRNASSNACIKLCYFLDQCKCSSSSTIQNFAFAEQTCLDLFNFYVEWNEKNQNRSMRQVLELISSLIARNPNTKTALSLKTTITERTLSIISHQAALPLVKPAFKCLEYLVGKDIIPVHTLIATDTMGNKVEDGQISTPNDTAWDRFFNGVFEWLSLADISPAAGKFLVTVFLTLKKNGKQGSTSNEGQYSASWQRWISNGLARDPECLENVKNYLFSPLFKLDRPGSIVFLQDINATISPAASSNQIEEANQLLRLCAMETGKKAGLIEEPGKLLHAIPS
jgi:hypothetical protein